MQTLRYTPLAYVVVVSHVNYLVISAILTSSHICNAFSIETVLGVWSRKPTDPKKGQTIPRGSSGHQSRTT